MPERLRPRLRPDRPPEHPWLIRGIVVAACAIVVAGLVASLLLGHLMR